MLKKLLLSAIGVSALFAIAIAATGTPKNAQADCAKCPGKSAPVASAKPAGACADKSARACATKSASAKPAGACADKSAEACAPKVATARAEGMCCKSTAARPIRKGAPGCCSAPNSPARFKVFADGDWYFFGCRGSAARGRARLNTMAFRVGQVLPVTSRVLMPRAQAFLGVPL